VTIYGAGQDWPAGEFASILAIGDSWFWYPDNNLLESLASHPRLRDEYRTIQLLGFNGARLSEYTHGRYAAEFRRQMKRDNSQYYRAVFVSGAGNDAIHYHLALAKNCRGQTDPASCVDGSGMATLLQGVSADLTRLIGEISNAISAQNRIVDIVLHGYDYVVPDGRGFGLLPGITVGGPWLSKAMNSRFVPDDFPERKAICRNLIDGLNATFAAFDGQAGPGYRVHYIDSRGTLLQNDDYRTDWANEIHPTPRGFDKIVDSKWIPRLRALGFAT
jgi:hypothetical protein